MWLWEEVKVKIPKYVAKHSCLPVTMASEFLNIAVAWTCGRTKNFLLCPNIIFFLMKNILSLSWFSLPWPSPCRECSGLAVRQGYLKNISTQEILVFWAQHFWDFLLAVPWFLELVVSVLAAWISGYDINIFVETKRRHTLSESFRPHIQNTFNFNLSIHNFFLSFFYTWQSSCYKLY